MPRFLVQLNSNSDHQQIKTNDKYSNKPKCFFSWATEILVHFTSETTVAKRTKAPNQHKQTSDRDEGNHLDQKGIIFKSNFKLNSQKHWQRKSSFPKSMKTVDLNSTSNNPNLQQREENQSSENQINPGKIKSKGGSKFFSKNWEKSCSCNRKVNFFKV